MSAGALLRGLGRLGVPLSRLVLLSSLALTRPAAAVPDKPTPAPDRSSPYALPLLGAYRKTMEIEEQIQQACDAYGVPLPLARGVCMYESGGDGELTSRAGARGYFQVMPATLRLMKVPSNIEAGVKYLGTLLAQFPREDDALAAYNGGPGRVKKGRPMPIETLQYVVGVGIYRTLLAREEPQIRGDAGNLDLYRVGPGDAWESVSEKTGVPVLDLRLYNPYLATGPLRPGALVAHPRPDTLSFVGSRPPGAEPGFVYETRRGDNYLLLAFALDVDVDSFRKDNSLWRIQPPFERLSLVVNPRKRPPDADRATAVAASPGQAGAPEDGSPTLPNTLVHKVQRGETLSRIASIYRVSVDSILKANNLRRTRLKVGQVLLIPAA